jgi:hypothetical protein
MARARAHAHHGALTSRILATIRAS